MIRRARLAARLAVPLIGGLAGAVSLAHRSAPGNGVLTITMTAVAVAFDGRTGDAVVAGSDRAGSWVRVLDPRTGATLRSVAVRGGVSAGGEFVPASVLALDTSRHRAVVTTIVAGRGVVGTGYVNVVDTRTGQRVAVAVPPRTLPVAVALDARRGRAAVLTMNNSTVSLDQNLGGVLLLDTRSGRVIRTALANQGPRAVAVEEQTGQVAVVCQPADPRTGSPRGPARLALLDAATGRPVRSVILPRTHGKILSMGFDQNRIVLLGADEGPPYASTALVLDRRSGRVLRTTQAGVGPGKMVVDARADRVVVTTQQAVPPLRGQVTVLDTTGRLIHALAFHGLSGPAVVDARAGRIFVTITRVNARDVGIGPGQVLMLDARSGRILHTASIGANPAALTLDARHGRLLVATTGERDESLPYWPPRGDGRVSVIDTVSGRALRPVPVGMDPFAVAVDGRTGRAAVLARGGTIRVRPIDPWGWVPSWVRRHLPLVAPPPQSRERAVPATVSFLTFAP